MVNRLYDNSDKVNPLRDNPLKQAQREARRIDNAKQAEKDRQKQELDEWRRRH